LNVDQKGAQSEGLLSILHEVLFSFYRVVSAATERVTTQYSAQGEKAAFNGPVTGNGLLGIYRTGRGKTTGRRKERGNKVLISPDKPK